MDRRQAIECYAKRRKLMDKAGKPKQGEAVRELIGLGLSHESDIKQAYSQGHADGARESVDQRSMSGMRGKGRRGGS